jgi:predicted ATP-grasp superfamily ATP-dependent carboligase
MRLAILGASARAAAFSALAAGHDVVAADLFADFDLTGRCDATRITDWPREFGLWLAQQECDGWLYTGGLENYPELIDAWSAISPLFGIGGDTLRVLRDPGELARLLRSYGVPTPEVRFSPPGTSSGEEWLIKRRHSSGGLGIHPWTLGSEPQAEEYLQRRIAGEPIAAVFVAAGREARCWGITRQLIAPPWTHAHGFQYAGSIGPVEIDEQMVGTIERAGHAIARELGLEGMFGVDLVVDSEGTAWVIEVNPRYTASMEVVERFRGESAVGLHVSACRQQALPTLGSISSQGGMAPKMAGKAYLFAPQDLAPSHEVVDCLQELAQASLAADLPYPGVPIPSGAPVTTIFSEGNNCQEVERALQRRIEQVTQMLLTGSPV